MDLQIRKPHLAVAHITEKLIPRNLYKYRAYIMVWRKNENLHREYFNCFRRALAEQAKKLQI